jgi:hypothetical protein
LLGAIPEDAFVSEYELKETLLELARRITGGTGGGRDDGEHDKRMKRMG